MVCVYHVGCDIVSSIIPLDLCARRSCPERTLKKTYLTELIYYTNLIKIAPLTKQNASNTSQQRKIEQSIRDIGELTATS